MTWVSSFATYIAIIAQAHPERVLDLLAYMRLIIREATKYGGHGWLTYDTVFRRNQEGSSQLWNFINPSLHIAYIVGQDSPPTPPCQYCNEADHASQVCALAPLAPRTKGSPREQPSNRGKAPVPRGKFSTPFTPYPPRGISQRVCHSWNKGRCAFPGVCAYSHICAVCEGGHQAKDCP